MDFFNVDCSQSGRSEVGFYPITPKFRLLPVTVQSYKTLSLSCVRLIAVVIFQSFNDAKCVNQLTNQHNNSVRGSVYNER